MELIMGMKEASLLKKKCWVVGRIMFNVYNQWISSIKKGICWSPKLCNRMGFPNHHKSVNIAPVFKSNFLEKQR